MAFYKATSRCSFITTTAIKICVNDNAACATRNNPIAADLKYDIHFAAFEFTFGKNLRFVCDSVAIAMLDLFHIVFPRCKFSNFPSVFFFI